jgi:hypothetical protein
MLMAPAGAAVPTYDTARCLELKITTTSNKPAYCRLWKGMHRRTPHSANQQSRPVRAQNMTLSKVWTCSTYKHVPVGSRQDETRPYSSITHHDMTPRLLDLESMIYMFNCTTSGTAQWVNTALNERATVHAGVRWLCLLVCWIAAAFTPQHAPRITWNITCSTATGTKPAITGEHSRAHPVKHGRTLCIRRTACQHAAKYCMVS